MDHFGMPAVIAALVFAIPVLAIMGGIIAGILKAQGRRRLVELIQRERIAAIERGVDPSKLPPPPTLDIDAASVATLVRSFRQSNAQKAQGFLITGLIILATGIGLSLMLLLLPDEEANRAWATGILPLSVGIALIVSSAIVRRGPDDHTDNATKS
jgi:hypothetical protein